jgi:hypothetical protein
MEWADACVEMPKIEFPNDEGMTEHKWRKATGTCFGIRISFVIVIEPALRLSLHAHGSGDFTTSTEQGRRVRTRSAVEPRRR